MRIVVILFLIAILVSLFSSLILIFTDRGSSQVRVARALTIRVGLSVALFVLLMAGYYFGFIGNRLA